MKIQLNFAVLAIFALQLHTGSAQETTSFAPQSSAAYRLSSGAVEVEKLAKSGVGDDVVLSFINQSQSYYSLSDSDILQLKNAGVSSQAVTAMLNHDGALHSQQQAALPTASAPSSTPATATATTAVATPASTTTVVVNPPPAPTPQVEVIPVTPGPDYIWTPGWWSWNGTVWVWFGGYWGLPVRPGHVYVDGRFVHGRGVEMIRDHRR